jgi:hypothetical protein
MSNISRNSLWNKSEQLICFPQKRDIGIALLSHSLSIYLYLSICHSLSIFPSVILFLSFYLSFSFYLSICHSLSIFPSVILFLGIFLSVILYLTSPISHSVCLYLSFSLILSVSISLSFSHSLYLPLSLCIYIYKFSFPPIYLSLSLSIPPLSILSHSRNKVKPTLLRVLAGNKVSG